MKARYLTFFSYIGTKFRSSEKIWLKGGRNYPDPESIQGLMELSLLNLRPINYPNLTLSSRTDGGVHALNASAHFDLEKHGNTIYDTDFITYTMNRYFFKKSLSIFVKKCLHVNDNFHARFNAQSRTYMYRFAVLKPDSECGERSTIASFIPIEEWKRCLFLRLKNFDIERFKAGAKYLEGYHDFATFKRFDKLNLNKHTRREIKSIIVRPGAPCVTSYSSGCKNYFDYWEVMIEGRGFLHNQIRRMLGTLISVATGQLEPKDIQVMLQIPSKHSWHTFIQCSPPDGLYLCSVGYDPEHLVYNPSNIINTDNKNEFPEGTDEAERAIEGN